MRSIVWSKSAEDSFFNHLRYIEADSPTSAEKVARELIIVIDDLITNPEKFPPDRFKMANDGSYRAFEKFSLRVVYRFTKTEVKILRVRHVRQEPRAY